jgi:hypothetical protein
MYAEAQVELEGSASVSGNRCYSIGHQSGRYLPEYSSRHMSVQFCALSFTPLFDIDKLSDNTEISILRSGN